MMRSARSNPCTMCIPHYKTVTFGATTYGVCATVPLDGGDEINSACHVSEGAGIDVALV